MLRTGWAVTFIYLSLVGLAHGADLAHAPNVRVGDTWKYNQLDGFTNEIKFEFSRRVVGISDSEITIEQTIKGRAGYRVIIYDRFWNLIDNGTLKFEPSNGVQSFPVTIGKVLRKEYREKNIKTGVFSVCTVSGQYVGWEKVTVPAGTFDTLRLEDEIECRSTGADAAINKTAHKSWYAPSVNKYVRTESQTVRDGRVREKTGTELVEYSPARPDPGHAP